VVGTVTALLQELPAAAAGWSDRLVLLTLLIERGWCVKGG